MSAVRERVIYTGKRAAAGLLAASGATGFLSRRKLGGRAIVLAYHRVLPEGTPTWSHPAVIVRPETFEAQMLALRDHYRVLSLAAFEAHVASGTPFPSQSCLVTFDDGWYDTWAYAWPVLRRLEIPAAVFLATQYIGSGETFWQERLGAVVWHAAGQARGDDAAVGRLAQALEASGLGSIGPAAWRGDRAALIHAIRTLKSDASLDPVTATRCLQERLDVRPPIEHDRFMTWLEVREMAHGGIAFGVHGHTHRMMTRLSGPELDDELTTARGLIEREAGVGVTSMSYPNGDWNSEIAAQVRARGFQSAFSMVRGPAASTTPLYAVPRVNIHEGVTNTVPLFRARVSGVM